eukprot:14046182-Heterocapsa_arctica.AAC.1
MEAELINAHVAVVPVLLVDQPLLQGVVRQGVAGVRVAVHLSRDCRRGAEDVDVTSAVVDVGVVVVVVIVVVAGP